MWGLLAGRPVHEEEEDEEEEGDEEEEEKETSDSSGETNDGSCNREYIRHKKRATIMTRWGIPMAVKDAVEGILKDGFDMVARTEEVAKRTDV